MPEPYNIDADLLNADWPKRTIDLPATNILALRRYLHTHGMTVEEFKALPMYTLALRSGRYDWLHAL